MMTTDIDQSERRFLIHLDAVNVLLRQLALPAEVTQSLLEEETQRHQQHLYLRMAYAFYKHYPVLTEEEKTTISTATYLSATAVYAVDHVLDLQVTGAAIRPIFRLSHLCFLESQRLLATLFPLQDGFWKQYYQRYEDHFHELELSALAEPLDEIKYREILSCKYALLHVVIDMLDHLSKKQFEERSRHFHSLLDEFTFGYNLTNEVKGIKSDLETGINNYAFWDMKARLPERSLSMQDEPEYLSKLLYASGLAQEMIAEANGVLNNVSEMAEEMDLPDFMLIVQMRMAENRKRLVALESYFREMDAKLAAV